MALRISLVILIVAILFLAEALVTGTPGPEAAAPLSELGMANSHAP